eukprot:897065-Pleurochrysis_carterae.AAC.1
MHAPTRRGHVAVHANALALVRTVSHARTHARIVPLWGVATAGALARARDCAESADPVPHRLQAAGADPRTYFTNASVTKCHYL